LATALASAIALFKSKVLIGLQPTYGKIARACEKEGYKATRARRRAERLTIMCEVRTRNQVTRAIWKDKWVLKS